MKKTNIEIKHLKQQVAVNEKKRLFRISLSEYLAKSMPSFKTGLSPKQKRELIRNHVGDVKRDEIGQPFKLNAHDIYSITCAVMASKYGLNE